MTDYDVNSLEYLMKSTINLCYKKILLAENIETITNLEPCMAFLLAKSAALVKIPDDVLTETDIEEIIKILRYYSNWLENLSNCTSAPPEQNK